MHLMTDKHRVSSRTGLSTMIRYFSMPILTRRMGPLRVRHIGAVDATLNSLGLRASPKEDWTVFYRSSFASNVSTTLRVPRSIRFSRVAPGEAAIALPGLWSQRP